MLIHATFTLSLHKNIAEPRNAHLCCKLVYIPYYKLRVNPESRLSRRRTELDSVPPSFGKLPERMKVVGTIFRGDTRTCQSNFASAACKLITKKTVMRDVD